MTIQQCKYVLEIAETGSFSEAAKQLFIAQPSLSGCVKQLENELGIQIFGRSNRGVYLTDEGAEFVRYASQIVQQSECILERYRDSEKMHKLYISTQHYDFVADIFGRLLNESKLAQYRFRLKETQTYDIICEVETAFNDIGILAVKDGDRELMERLLSKRGLSFTPFLDTIPHVFVR